MKSFRKSEGVTNESRAFLVARDVDAQDRVGGGALGGKLQPAAAGNRCQWYVCGGNFLIAGRSLAAINTFRIGLLGHRHAIHCLRSGFEMSLAAEGWSLPRFKLMPAAQY